MHRINSQLCMAIICEVLILHLQMSEIGCSGATNNFSISLQWLAWLASGISELSIFFHEWIWPLSSGGSQIFRPWLANKILFVSKIQANRSACNGLP